MKTRVGANRRLGLASCFLSGLLGRLRTSCLAAQVIVRVTSQLEADHVRPPAHRRRYPCRVDRKASGVGVYTTRSARVLASSAALLAHREIVGHKQKAFPLLLVGNKSERCNIVSTAELTEDFLHNSSRAHHRRHAITQH